MGANPEEATDIENMWKSFHDSTLNVATDVLGFVKRKHQDWFEENDEEIEPLLRNARCTPRLHREQTVSSSQEDLPGIQTGRPETPETNEEQVVGR